MNACHLVGRFPLSTVYSRVNAARERGTYDVLRLREEQEIRSLVIEIDGSNNPDDDPPTISSTTTDETGGGGDDSSGSAHT